MTALSFASPRVRRSADDLAARVLRLLLVALGALIVVAGFLIAPLPGPMGLPVAVIVSEYVDIAKAFYSEEEPKLVNAVLDRVARRVRGEGRGKDAR